MATPAEPYDELADLLPDLQGLETEQLREVIERASSVQEMTQHRAWPIYCDYLIALTVGTQNRVLTGSCVSFEEYHRLVGRVEGIRWALQAPDKLLSQIEAIRAQAEEAFQMEGEELDSATGGY